MKVRCDEHVSPRIVRVIRDFALSPEWELTSVLEVHQGGASDVRWISDFARDGGQSIVTGDRDFLKLEAQVNAVFDCGLKVIHLPSKWCTATGPLQAAHLLQWWSRIENKITHMKTRQCFRPDYNINLDGDLKLVKIDFAKAQRKRRKSKRLND